MSFYSDAISNVAKAATGGGGAAGSTSSWLGGLKEMWPYLAMQGVGAGLSAAGNAASSKQNAQTQLYLGQLDNQSRLYATQLDAYLQEMGLQQQDRQAIMQALLQSGQLEQAARQAQIDDELNRQKLTLESTQLDPLKQQRSRAQMAAIGDVLGGGGFQYQPPTNYRIGHPESAMPTRTGGYPQASQFLTNAALANAEVPFQQAVAGLGGEGGLTDTSKVGYGGAGQAPPSALQAAARTRNQQAFQQMLGSNDTMRQQMLAALNARTPTTVPAPTAPTAATPVLPDFAKSASANNPSQASSGRSTASRLGGAASGALSGAAAGSFLPGPGTAIGALLGGLLGLFKK